MKEIHVAIKENNEMVVTVGDEIVYTGPVSERDPFVESLAAYAKERDAARKAATDPELLETENLMDALRSEFKKTGKINPQLADRLLDLEERPF